MIEYRPVPEDDLDAYRAVLDYAFRAEAGPEPERDDEPDPLGERRGLFDGDTLVTTAKHHRFTVSVRGRWLDVAGLSAVATLPQHRRQGYVRQLLFESLAEYREWDRPFCLLWPFKHAFYRRFGWGRLAELGRYEFEPDAVSAVADHPLAGGEFRRLDPDDDVGALQSLDARYADRYDLAMARTEDWYRNRYFESLTGDPFVYGWSRDGELRGALRYVVQEADDESVLRVLEFGAPDDAANVNLLRFLHRHEDQADRIQLYAPVDDLLFDLVEDPPAVELAVRPGPMGRIVDVESALEALPPPTNVEASVTLSVTDGLADWNDDTFAVDASGGAFEVERGATDGPTASLPIETLSRLALGTTTARRAAVAGGLEADETARDRIRDLFPPRETFLREFF